MSLKVELNKMSLKVDLNKKNPLFKNYDLIKIDDNIGYYILNETGMEIYEELLNKRKHEYFLKLLVEKYLYFIRRREMKKKAREKNERKRIKKIERRKRTLKKAGFDS